MSAFSILGIRRARNPTKPLEDNLSIRSRGVFLKCFNATRMGRVVLLVMARKRQKKEASRALDA